jgi:hypothetical protein
MYFSCVYVYDFDQKDCSNDYKMRIKRQEMSSIWYFMGNRPLKVFNKIKSKIYDLPVFDKSHCFHLNSKN